MMLLLWKQWLCVCEKVVQLWLRLGRRRWCRYHIRSEANGHQHHVRMADLTSVAPSRLAVALCVHDGRVIVHVLVATHTPVTAWFWFVQNLEPAFVTATVAHVTAAHHPMTRVGVSIKTEVVSGEF